MTAVILVVVLLVSTIGLMPRPGQSRGLSRVVLGVLALAEAALIVLLLTDEAISSSPWVVAGIAVLAAIVVTFWCFAVVSELQRPTDSS
ncbi:hypothetical protein ASD13_17065 [Microbacterium sp. Root1433D1]|uniref:hypothetical protein n=1 Tax=unclassified Microbacterium TaxID=2609290 RepID=UPI0006FAAA35|nr:MULTISPECIES: hypothetical protein [unclassified Microbacterium]KQV02965.1 hypothetical protein ASC55_12100 [Microbacterium sp. Root322]KQY73417.1 hypothetical protein ASD13_17065 [Microbacterium sp. Root1433D1]